MKTDAYYRKELVFHLTVGHAHMSYEEATAKFPLKKMNELFPNGKYSFWHLLEHIRRTQKDILDFIVDPQYKEPSWPKEYWPQENKEATQEIWDKTIKSYFMDRKELVELIENPNTDLTKKLPQGTGQTLAREISVVTDHTSYHLGEFAIMRQVLDAWGKDHK